MYCFNISANLIPHTVYHESFEAEKYQYIGINNQYRYFSNIKFTNIFAKQTDLILILQYTLIKQSL